MLFSSPVSFSDAVKLNAVKQVLPTALNSRELQALDEGFHRRALVVSRVENARYLDGLRNTLDGILKGTQSLTYGRLEMQKLMDQLGGEGIRPDLATEKSIDRMIETNLRTTRGYAAMLAGNDPIALEDSPALELVRFEERNVPRGSPEYKAGTPGAIGWDERWLRSAQISGDDDAARVFTETGRMIALKDSDIWDTLGDSGVFPDGLDNPYAPFAWDSGMDTLEVSRAEAIKLGLMDPEDHVEPMDMPGFNENFEMSPGLANDDILSALLESLADYVTLKDGVLRFVGTVLGIDPTKGSSHR